LDEALGAIAGVVIDLAKRAAVIAEHRGLVDLDLSHRLEATVAGVAAAVGGRAAEKRVVLTERDRQTRAGALAVRGEIVDGRLRPGVGRGAHVRAGRDEP